MDKPVTHTRIVIPHKDGYKVIRLSEIIYIESQDSICRIYEKSSRAIDTTYLRINELANKLPFHLFCRIHKGYIVSLEHIATINKKNPAYVLKVINGYLLAVLIRPT